MENNRMTVAEIIETTQNAIELLKAQVEELSDDGPWVFEDKFAYVTDEVLKLSVFMIVANTHVQKGEVQ